VAEGADLTSINSAEYRHTPLHQAVYHRRPDMVRTLIELCNAKDVLNQVLSMTSNPCGRGTTGTPLDIAKGSGSEAIVSMLQNASNGGKEAATAQTVGEAVKLTRIGLAPGSGGKLSWT